MAYGDGILLPYQLEYLNDPARFKAGMFCRQGGKTFTTTLEAVLDCYEAETLGEARKWTILSVSRARAQDAMNDGVKLHLQALQTAFKELEIAPPPDRPLEETVYEVRFPSGSIIRTVAATPHTARGFSHNVILDEFAFHRDNRAIWQALIPVVSRPDLKFRVISTPNGKTEKFYEVMTSPEMGQDFSRHKVNIYRAVAEGLKRDIAELKRVLNDADAWAQEYELEFMDIAGSWLNYDLINACEHDDAGKPELYAGGLGYIGMDFGRRKNLTTLYFAEEVDEELWLRELVHMENMRFALQLAELARMFDTYRVVRAALDQTGMGEKPVEDAEDAHGKNRVEGVLFGGSTKLNMATALKSRMEDRRIWLPRDAELRTDLHSVTKKIGPTGIPRLAAPTLNGSHADRFWACALLCAAADSEDTPDLSQLQTTSSLKGLILPNGRGGWSIGGKDKYHGY